MHSTQRIKAAGATLTVGLLLATTLTATAQAGGPAQGLTARQLKAVEARAQGMDRYYRLGRYSPAAVALQADKRRAQSADRYYHLGGYAVIESANPFQWSDAGIGAGAMLGMILLGGGLALVFRRRSKPGVVSTG